VPTLLAKPALLIVATAVLLEVQVTVLVKSRVVLSLYVPVAVNCCVVPLAIEGFVGVTAIEVSDAVTVSVVEALVDPEVAWIVVVPVFTPVARPVLLIVATVVLFELHPTTPVMFSVLPSLYVPVAVNCCVAPLTIDGLLGVTDSETRVGGVTVRLVEPLIDPELA
jgi:hypothetical protein